MFVKFYILTQVYKSRYKLVFIGQKIDKQKIIDELDKI